MLFHKLLLALALTTVSTVLHPEPMVLFGPGSGAPLAQGRIKVTSKLLQISLVAHLVLSAEEDVEFMIEPLPTVGHRIRIIAGTAMIVDLDANTVDALTAGDSFDVHDLLRVPVTSDASAFVPQPDNRPTLTAYRFGYHLGDYAMVRQEEYLTVKMSALNQFLSSLLRGLAGTR